MGIFGEKHREMNAKPAFRVEQQEQQQTLDFFNQQIQQNVFKPADEEPQPEQELKKKSFGMFGKNEGTELASVGRLKSIAPEDVTLSMQSSIEQDMETLKDDHVSCGILRNIQIYNDMELNQEDRLVQFETVRKTLDMAFEEHTLELSEQGMQLLAKYQKHFNQLAGGNLKVPVEAPTEQRYYTKVDAAQKPPVDKEFKGRTIKQKDMKDVPLFDHEPHVSDLHQGMVGDCYLVAAMASIVSKDPQSVKDMMCDNGDGTVTVCLHVERTVSEVERETRWGNKKPEELTPRERLAKAFVSYDFNKTRCKAVADPSAFLSNMDADTCLLFADFFLAQDNWLNKEFLPQEGKTETDMLAEEINRVVDALDESAQLNFVAQIQAVFINQSSLRKLSGQPAPLDRVDTECFVTVKKEIAVDEPTDSPVYLRAPLWAQMLEKAYGAIAKEKKTIVNEGGKKAVETVTGYKALDEGGHSGEALATLLGRKAVFLVQNNESSNDINTTKSKYSLAGALESALAAHTDEKLIQSLRQKAPALQNAPDETIIELLKIIRKADKANIRTVKGETFRFQAAQIDDIIPLVLESRLKLVADKRAGATENEQLRQELAQQLTGLLKGAGAGFLSFKPFSGQYSDSAEALYEKIEESIAAGKEVNASTMGFVPKTVTEKPGLNRESMKDGLAETHAYTVLGVKEEQGIKYVTVRNPWGRTIRSYYKTEDGKIVASENETAETGGIFQVELNDFVANYNKVTAN